jgi:putative tryptophan/tyrosine transport system substrate-binding protein
MRPRRRGHLPVLVRLLAAGVLAVAVASCGASGGDPSPAGSGTPDSFEVGVLQVAQAAVLDDTVAAFQRRLAEELPPATVAFDLKNAQGDQGLIASIARDFAGSVR